jgi:hypothetical protein
VLAPVLAALIGLGMGIAAFVPASNVFIWVGTELAERLLYLPTVGLTITLATLLPPVPQSLARWAGLASCGHAVSARGGSSGPPSDPTPPPAPAKAPACSLPDVNSQWRAGRVPASICVLACV